MCGDDLDTGLGPVLDPQLETFQYPFDLRMSSEAFLAAYGVPRALAFAPRRSVQTRALYPAARPWDYFMALY